MALYFVVGLILLVGGAYGMVFSAKERAGVPALLSFIVTAIGAIVCLAILFL